MDKAFMRARLAFGLLSKSVSFSINWSIIIVIVTELALNILVFVCNYNIYMNLYL